MINYGRIKGKEKPQEITITENKVFMASNIEPYEEEIGDYILKGYEFDYISYTKDEYLKLMMEKNKSLEEQVLNTQMVLCELYEALGGDSL